MTKLSDATRRKLQTVAKGLRKTGRVGPLSSLSLKPGVRLVREWRGRAHTVTVTEDPAPSVRTLPTPALPISAPATEAPRTLRLLQATAQRVREAWLEAKRDDVLLTAQDFASELVDEALARRRRSRAINRG